MCVADLEAWITRMVLWMACSGDAEEAMVMGNHYDPLSLLNPLARWTCGVPFMG